MPPGGYDPSKDQFLLHWLPSPRRHVVSRRRGQFTPAGVIVWASLCAMFPLVFLPILIVVAVIRGA